MGCPLSASADPGSLPAVSVCVSWLPAASVLSTSVVVVALSGLATTGTDGPLGAVTVAGPLQGRRRLLLMRRALRRPARASDTSDHPRPSHTAHAVRGVAERLGEAREEGSDQSAGEAGLIGAGWAGGREVFEFEVLDHVRDQAC